MEYKRCDFDIDDSKTKIEKEELIKKIEKVRECLYNLIEVSDSVSSKEIIIESQKLDELLTVYEKLNNKDMLRHL